MKWIVLAALILAAPAAACAGWAPDAGYASVLESVVGEAGLVDYKGLAADRAALDEYVAAIGGLDHEVFDAWPSADRLAFLLNAYNALTLRLIIDNYDAALAGSDGGHPPGIRRIDGAWDRVTFAVMGADMTLDHLEHQIIRKEFDEPRVHMALVCAARSCPELRGEPYAGQRLDDQLDDQTRTFLSNASNFSIERERGVVRLSSIFDWFTDDFAGIHDVPAAAPHGDVILFVADYLDDSAREFLRDNHGGIDVVFIEYDWTLNDSGL